jgi:hypothetical protein
VGRACRGPSPGERSRSELLDNRRTHQVGTYGATASYNRSFRPGRRIVLTEEMRTDEYFRAALFMATRKSRIIRRSILAARAYVFGGTALHMICTKT